MRPDRFLPAALSSAAFRFGLLLALVFAGGAIALLVTVQRQVGGYAVEATNGRIRGEAQILAAEYRELGQSGLVDAMERHQKVGGDADFHYLLLDARGGRLFGDLPASAAREGWNMVQVVEDEPGHQPNRESMRTLAMHLPDGLTLVVGTDNFDIDNLRDRLGRFTLLSGIAISLFALLGGYLTGRLFLRRLDRVNGAIDRIIDGHSAERLPMIGLGPEFDDLARNLNRMIDRNAAAMEALRQVSSDIAHDLRTPLTRLHNSLEDMQDVGVDPAKIDDALAQTRGLLETFHALLRIGSVEGGVGRRHFKRLSLTELMDRIHQAYGPVAEDADHRLVADHAVEVSIDGDGELLAQLFANLIENALVHTPPGTTITSKLIFVDGSPCAEISDDGPGIPVEERANVFRRFYRLDASRNTEGAGLGLALVAAIASLHGADCTIADSRRGLCIRIRFDNSAPSCVS